MNATTSRTMTAKYPGTCVDCGTWFPKGSEIVFDGRAHCPDNCERVFAERRRERRAEQAEMIEANKRFREMSPADQARVTLDRAIEELAILEHRYATQRLSPFEWTQKDARIASANAKINEARAALARFES